MKLDNYLNQDVTLKLKNKSTLSGKLHKSNSDYVNHYNKKQKYILVTRDRNYMFEATNVRKVVEVYY